MPPCSNNNNNEDDAPSTKKKEGKKQDALSKVTSISNSSNNNILCTKSIVRILSKTPSRGLILVIISCMTLMYVLNISTLPTPYKTSSSYESKTNSETAYIATIKEKLNERPSSSNNTEATPNFYEMLTSSSEGRNLCSEKEQPLISHKCSKCLRKKGTGADCNLCDTVCECYCKYLCKVKPKPKFVKKELYVSPPLLVSKDSSRLIPRIVHQTWFEDPSLNPEKYPNLSRVSESWRQSGWDYRFYDDEAAADFLATHFPSEVLEAYDAIIPGSFKADLFRYCVLFIHGGVYADVDVFLDCNLDRAISSDVGFMLPHDKPGRNLDRGMCLWNGLIASAPAHPFLANAIQIVVNNIRNRFTNIDIDNLLCPNPTLILTHSFDVLFTAGPCILGLAINQVLNRHPQTQYSPGDLHTPYYRTTTQSSSIIIIPGRSIILHQNKTDMGAHRFTLQHKNLIVASTDLPSIIPLLQQNKDKPHYSKTHAKYGKIYGIGNNLYVDQNKSNDVIEIHIIIPNRFYILVLRFKKGIFVLDSSTNDWIQLFLCGVFIFCFCYCWFCYNKYKLRFIISSY